MAIMMMERRATVADLREVYLRAIERREIREAKRRREAAIRLAREAKARVLEAEMVMG